MYNVERAQRMAAAAARSATVKHVTFDETLARLRDLERADGEGGGREEVEGGRERGEGEEEGEGEAEEDEEEEAVYEEDELEDETDYNLNYFDNGEDYGGDYDDGDGKDMVRASAHLSLRGCRGSNLLEAAIRVENTLVLHVVAAYGGTLGDVGASAISWRRKEIHTSERP